MREIFSKIQDNGTKLSPLDAATTPTLPIHIYSREYLSSFVGDGSIVMPRYVLLKPLLRVGVGTNLHQVWLLESVKDPLWICYIEKVNLQRKEINKMNGGE